MNFKNYLAGTALAATAIASSFVAAGPSQASEPATHPSRPHLSGKTHIKCSTHFCVHYTLKGKDRVRKEDKNHNGVPDTVDTVLKAGEKSWKVYVKEYKFRAPASDLSLAAHGPNGKIDIYMKQPSAGEEFAGEALTESSARLGDRLTGYIMVAPKWYGSNVVRWFKYNGRKKITQTDPQDLQAVVAHEFFHVIQFGYKGFYDDSWEVESEAMWAESQVYPLHGTVQAVEDLWSPHSAHRSPSAPFETLNGLYGGSSLFALVEKTYGKNAVRKILEAGSVSEWAAKQKGGVAKLFARYTLANLAPAEHYKLGAYYPSVPRTTPLWDGAARTSTVLSTGSKTYQWKATGVAQAVSLGASISLPAFIRMSDLDVSPWPVVLTVLKKNGKVARREWHRVVPGGESLNLYVKAKRGSTVQLTVVNPDTPSFQTYVDHADGAASTEEHYDPTLTATFGRS